MDLLYFEYLRARLDEGSIGSVVVVPWSGWREERNANGESAVTTNIGKVFGEQSLQGDICHR